MGDFVVVYGTERLMYSFQEFQSFHPDSLEIASHIHLGFDYNYVFSTFEKEMKRKVNGRTISAEVVELFLDDELTHILKIWVESNKNMVLTRLRLE